MKNNKLQIISVLLVGLLTIESCGPIIISSRPQIPLPGWFYPNRVINVRYVYFPDYMVYYDITLRHYIYLENSTWVTVNVLPPRFDSVNFRRVRQVRIDNYFGDHIQNYHSNRVNVKGRRETKTSTTPRTRRQ